jgi:fucose 4-O-acetylase-like acetyltransferase
MSRTDALSARDLAGSTPASRDRYVDFLRLFSITVVVLGHWLMAVVIWKGHTFTSGNVIGMVPGMWIATWLLQVMPIFFFVGGFANFATIDALRRRGGGSPEFVASRVARLLKPIAVLLAVWIPAAALLEHAGLDARVLGAATKLVCQPLWFIGVYLAVTALAPFMRTQHARHAAGTLAIVGGAAIAVDALRFGAGIDALGYLNTLFVWLFAHQLGFFYADGTLVRATRTRLATIAAGAIALLAVLTTFGPYPHSMVGLPGDRVSNMSPPTICLLVLTVFEVAVAMLLRPIVQRRLQRERVWTAVVAGNGVIMTIFLWHLTAALIAVGTLYPIGFPQPAGGSALWWATRPLWIAVATLPLIGLVALFGRFERPRAARYTASRPGGRVAAGVGIALLSFAVFGIACSNVADLISGARINVAVITVTPLVLLLAAAAGLACVHHGARRVPLVVDVVSANFD